MDRLPGWENFKWAYIFVFIWAGCFTGALVASMLESAGIIDTQSAALADRILYRGFLGALAGIILGAISGLHTVLSAISERAKEKRKRERDDGQS